jgi:hypothetical protein
LLRQVALGFTTLSSSPPILLGFPLHRWRFRFLTKVLETPPISFRGSQPDLLMQLIHFLD